MDKITPSKLTNMNTSSVLILLCIILISCNTPQKQVEKDIYYPNQSIHQDSILSLKGTLSINSKGALLFKELNYAAEGRGSATYLIPQDAQLKKYVESHYDAYLHLKNLKEPFFILIQGKYLTDNLLHSEDSTSFLFNFVALLDERDLID